MCIRDRWRASHSNTTLEPDVDRASHIPSSYLLYMVNSYPSDVTSVVPILKSLAVAVLKFFMAMFKWWDKDNGYFGNVNSFLKLFLIIMLLTLQTGCDGVIVKWISVVSMKVLESRKVLEMWGQFFRIVTFELGRPKDAVNWDHAIITDLIQSDLYISYFCHLLLIWFSWQVVGSIVRHDLRTPYPRLVEDGFRLMA